MTDNLRNKLISLAKNIISDINDPSHDILHSLRVLSNAEKIANEENADLDIVIPAALFHDIIVYPKHSAKAKDSSVDSAEIAEKVLLDIAEYPKEKIQDVKSVIMASTFTYGIDYDSLEKRVVHDADLLEATGLVGAMRTFGSCGSMNRPFYSIDDPFADSRQLDEMQFGLDHFYERLLIAKNRIVSESGKKIAERRTRVLRRFLDDLRTEINGE